MVLLGNFNALFGFSIIMTLQNAAISGLSLYNLTMAFRSRQRKMLLLWFVMLVIAMACILVWWFIPLCLASLFWQVNVIYEYFLPFGWFTFAAPDLVLAALWFKRPEDFFVSPRGSRRVIQVRRNTT